MKTKTALLLTTLLLTAGVSLAVPAHASATSKSADTKKTVTGTWKIKSKKVYYIYSNGKKAKGLTQIGKKTYYFNKQGVQMNGWQTVAGDTYFFRIANGKQGSMVTSKKVNGITLRKNGTAKVSGASAEKLKILIKAQTIVSQITKPTMSKSDKLKACWKYILKYRYQGSPKFQHTTNWDIDYASSMFRNKHGSCYHYGAAFAYLANACGYTTAKAVSSGGHGWAEVDDMVYDPTWEMVDKNHSYYAVSKSLSGVGGRPNYKRAGCYVKKI